MLPKTPGIYIATNTVNGKVWIGQAVGLSGIWGRYQGHLKKFRAGKNSPHFQAAWEAYGPSSFTWEVLLLCPPEECDFWEEFFITTFRSHDREFGYNIASKARGTGRCSEETKEKMRKANTGRRPSEEALAKMRGREFSEEHKSKLAEANRRRAPEMAILMKGRPGKPISEETKEKIKAFHTGRKRTDDTKRRISEGLKGKNHTSTGTVWMHEPSTGQNRRVPPEGVQALTDLGWKLGRSKS